jgi:hypothetical protein
MSRLLGQPGNLTADTAAELLFAISGGEIQYSMAYKISRQPKADTRVEVTLTNSGPDWSPSCAQKAAIVTSISSIVGKLKGTIVPAPDQRIAVLAA